VPVTVMRDVSPRDGYLYSSINLTNQWQTFTIAVTGSFAIGDSGRVSLDVEYAPGNVYARNMTLVQAGQRGLAAGESIEAANISLLGPSEGATAARMADYVSFLIATDRNYVNSLRDTVRGATDSLAPITGTQMGYGGLAILDSQDGLDYQDNHFYIDHYNFPNTAWDGLDWRIRDATAASSTWSSFLDMAWARQAGRPYTVSEFNQPWPNTHGAELDVSLAAFGAFQDWDGIMHFAYSHGRNWDDGVPNGFNINGDWTKFPLIGQAAWLFRTGAVKRRESLVCAGIGGAAVGVGGERAIDRELGGNYRRHPQGDGIPAGGATREGRHVRPGGRNRAASAVSIEHGRTDFRLRRGLAGGECDIGGGCVRDAGTKPGDRGSGGLRAGLVGARLCVGAADGAR